MKIFIRKIFLLFFIIFFNTLTALAVEEIKLSPQNINLNIIPDFYYGKLEKDNDLPQNIEFLKIFTKDGYKFKNNTIIDSIKSGIAFSGYTKLDMPFDENLTSSYIFDTVQPYITMNFADKKTILKVSANLSRKLPDANNHFTEKISEVYIEHRFNNNQKLLIGQTYRAPIGHEGAESIIYQDFIYKAQIGKTYADVRPIGIRNIGNYKYLDYDIGFYDSTRYMQDFFKGNEIIANINIKPLSNVSDKYGNLTIGTSMNTGYRYGQYNVYGNYIGYDYKKVHFKFEYANAHGYNSPKSFSSNYSDGFYVSTAYDITPKLSILGRYDYINKDKHASNNSTQEITAGLNYKIMPNIRLMLNYIFQKNKNAPDSNAILFATRFVI